MITKIKGKKQCSLFEYQDRIEELTKKKGTLEQLNEIIPWEQFRGTLEKVFAREAKGPGGAPHFDYVMMFKVLIVQRFYSLSNAETEYQFNEYLRNKGYMGKEGVIVDATIVEAPRQHNSREENEKIRKGEMPESFKENPHKLCQKDVDARWLKKNGKNYFGYKNHIKIDKESKLILGAHATSANVHDSQAVEYLLDKKEDVGKKVWADSAYSEEIFSFV